MPTCYSVLKLYSFQYWLPIKDNHRSGVSSSHPGLSNHIKTISLYLVENISYQMTPSGWLDKAVKFEVIFQDLSRNVQEVFTSSLWRVFCDLLSCFLLFLCFALHQTLSNTVNKRQKDSIVSALNFQPDTKSQANHSVAHKANTH